jgi:hypothetical protein
LSILRGLRLRTKEKRINKRFSLEANIIATELVLDPCIGFNNLTYRLNDLKPSGNNFKPTVCRIVKKLGYATRP